MKKFIEFTWKYKYIFILLQSAFMSGRMEINFSRRQLSYENKVIMFDLITESSISLFIIFYLIERNKNKLHKDKIYKSYIKAINYLRISFIQDKKPKKNIKSNIFFYGLIFLTSIIKFFFSIFNYYISLRYYQNNYLITITVFFNLFFILDVIILAIIRTKILKRTLYFHNVIAIILLFILIIPISFIYFNFYKIDDFKLNLKYFLYFIGFFFILFTIMINFIIYKILVDKNFFNIYLINSIEGFLISIYTIIFYFLIIKKQNRENFGEPLNFPYFKLILSCIFQIVINYLIKYIIYEFNEMYETIAYILQMVIDVIKNSIFEKYYKDNFFLFIILLILNILLVLDVLFFTETIIIKVCGLEKKTKKYLEIQQISENDDINEKNDDINENEENNEYEEINENNENE